MPRWRSALIVVVGRLLLRPLFRLVASARAPANCSWPRRCSSSSAPAFIAGLAGLSMALGAFVAGLLLAETEFRKAIETTIEPFKGLLLGVFFFTVGMSIDLRELAREPFWLLALGGRPDRHQGRADRPAWRGCSACRCRRRSRPACCWARAASSPSSPSASPRRSARRGADVASFTLAVTSLTMALIPLLAAGRAAHHRPTGAPQSARARAAVAPPVGSSGHAIVVGHGRVGQIVCDMLERHRFPFLATDSDPAAVARISPPRPARSTTATPPTRRS